MGDETFKIIDKELNEINLYDDSYNNIVIIIKDTEGIESDVWLCLDEEMTTKLIHTLLVLRDGIYMKRK